LIEEELKDLKEVKILLEAGSITGTHCSSVPFLVDSLL